MGSLISLNVVITNNLSPEISSFFFCTLLFYLFFEVFFSFFRKLYEGKSPIYPDNKHLHMLSFYKLSAVYGRDKSNFLNSILINLVYLILILPGLYFMEHPNLSRYWFFILLLIYMIFYSRLYYLTKIKLLYKSYVYTSGQVAELVYALVLETSAARLKSSSLFLPTK